MPSSEPDSNENLTVRDRQLELETGMARKGVERYRANELAAAHEGDHAATAAGRKFICDVMGKVATEMTSRGKDALVFLKGKAKKDAFLKWTASLSIDPDRLAFITISTVFSFRAFRVDDYEEDGSDTAGYEPLPFMAVAADVGRRVLQERRADVSFDVRRQVRGLEQATKYEDEGELVKAFGELERIVEIAGDDLCDDDKRSLNASKAQKEMKRLYNKGAVGNPERTPSQPKAINVTAMVGAALSAATSSLTKKEKDDRLTGIREAEASLHTLRLRATTSNRKCFSQSKLVQIGGELIERLLQSGQRLFTRVEIPERGNDGKVKKGSKKKASGIQLTPYGLKMLGDEHARRELECPWLSPMVCPPEPWRWESESCDYGGGYLQIEVPLIRHQQRRSHTASLSNPLSEATLSAINRIQATPWRVNRKVKQVMKTLLEHPEGLALDMPVVLSQDEEEWTTNRRTLQRSLDTAEAYRGEKEFWFPHSIDFRGRTYPYSQDLHPQLGDTPRALLEFAQGRSLGTDGYKYLASHIASLYSSQTGSTRDEQVQWTEDHTEEIRSLVNDPLSGISFWKEASKPWRFFAGCVEWNRLQEEGVRNFLSHMPILMDGTCNGLQHLAALTRDPELAKAVNLMSGERRDVYQDVANAVTQEIHRQIKVGKPVPDPLRNLTLSRDHMKPCVMPIPYGVSKTGISKVLVKQLTSGIEGENDGAAKYLSKIVWDHVQEQWGRAIEVMDWLKSLTKSLFNLMQPLMWKTPTGSNVLMAYYKTTSKIVKLFSVPPLQQHREVRVHDEARKKGLDWKLQMRGAAPNFIHSLDAAHLMKTVNACAEAGIQDFMMIHDAYGTHACNAAVMSRILREQFVEMYQDDILSTLWQECQQNNPQLQVPMGGPPARGDFSVDQVLKSEFFFS